MIFLLCQLFQYWQSPGLSMLLHMTLFLYFNGWVVVHCIYVPHHLYPLLYHQLGCVRVLAVVNHAALNVEVHVSFQTMILSECMPRSETVGSHGGSVVAVVWLLSPVWFCNPMDGSHPTVSSSVIPFSFFLQSFPPSGFFLMNRLFASGDPSIGASTSASVLPMNIQGWLPLRLTGLISLQSKGLSRVFSNTTVQKHQFFSTQPSLWSNSHILTWLLEKL